MSLEQAKTLVAEVLIKGKSLLNPQAPHDLEAHPINQADVPPPGSDQRGHGGGVYRFVHPCHLDRRQQILLERTYCFQAQALLYQGRSFHQHVIVRQELLVGAQYADPVPLCFMVMGVVAVQ